MPFRIAIDSIAKLYKQKSSHDSKNNFFFKYCYCHWTTVETSIKLYKETLDVRSLNDHINRNSLLLRFLENLLVTTKTLIYSLVMSILSKAFLLNQKCKENLTNNDDYSLNSAPFSQ